jgi:predicted N-acetyltransferase YhbS
MQDITLRPPTPEDVPELGRICFEAFKDVSEKHGFESDFTSLEMTRTIIGSIVRDESQYGVAASVDGQLAASNYIFHSDEAAGVGPVNVDPTRQGIGLGRLIMEDVMAHARESGLEMIRLVQDAFNVVSISLYASFGFDTKAPIGVLALAPGLAPDERIRPLGPDDADAADTLCRSIYGISRRNELAGRSAWGIPTLGIFRGGALRGYLSPAIIGHGVAETEDDMLALMREASRLSPEQPRVVCPLTSGELFRRALADGHQLVKIMNLMAVGPYKEPTGVWMPSVAF